MQRQNFLTTKWPGIHSFFPMSEFGSDKIIMDQVAGYGLQPKNVATSDILDVSPEFGISLSAYNHGSSLEPYGAMSALNGAITEGNFLFVAVTNCNANTNVGFGSWASGADPYFGVSYANLTESTAAWLGDANTPGGQESVSLPNTDDQFIYSAGYVQGIGTQGKMIRTVNGQASNETDYSVVGANIAPFPFGAKQAMYWDMLSQKSHGLMIYRPSTTLTLAEIEAIGAECRDRWSVGDKLPPDLLLGV